MSNPVDDVPNPDATPSEEEVTQQKSTEFNTSCFLLDYTNTIVQRQRKLRSGNTGGRSSGVWFTSSTETRDIFSNAYFTNIDQLPYSDFSQFIGKVTQRDSMKLFSELPNYLVSSLFPIVKIYRLDYGDQERKLPPKKRVFLFNKPVDDIFNTSPEDYKIGGLGGCGIKNITYTLAGTNPVEAERAVDVSLTLFFSSNYEFLGKNTDLDPDLNTSDDTDEKDPTGTNSNLVTSTKKYISLIQRPVPKNSQLYEGKDFEIVLEISYGISADETDPLYQDLKLALEKYKLILNLSLINHELNFTEEGTLELKINYFGSIQQYMNDPTTDYFQNAAKSIPQYSSAVQASEDAKSDYDKALSESKKCGTTVTKEQLEEKLNEVKKTKLKEEDIFTSTVKSKVYSSFLENLFKNRQLYTFEVDNQNVNKWIDYINGQGTKPDFSTFTFQEEKTDPEKAADEASRFANEDSDTITTAISDLRTKRIKINENVVITYFYFGDLLQSIADTYQLTTTNYRIILGDVEYKEKPDDKKTKKFNLSEVLIDINLFQAWFLEKIIKPNRVSYRFDQLLRDLVNGLLRPSLDTECLNVNINNKNIKIDLNLTTFTLAGDSTYGADPIGYSGAVSENGSIVNKNLNFGDKKKLYTYYCLFGKPQLCSRNGDPSRDGDDGIMHMYVGKANGLVTSIKFKRIDLPYAKEAKATRQGFTPISALRDIYNCDITMVGNNMFYPGMSVFINPPYQFGDPRLTNKSLANIMGIGGYYNIIKITTDISDSKFETRLDCYYQSSGDNCGIDNRCKS